MNKLLPILTFLLLSFLSQYSNAQGPGSALKLDGIDDVVQFSNDNRGVTNQLTVEAWIKTNSTGHQHIISKYDRDAEKGFQLLIQNGKACLAGRDGSGLYRTSGYSNTIVADDNWHHIAGVVQNGTWMLYVDGVLEQKSETGYTNTILSSNESLWIGNYYYVFLGNHFYRGQVDEVKLWKRALTADEIRQKMCSSAPPDAPDLVGYFKFDNLENGLVRDHSSQKKDGRLQNTLPSMVAVISGAPIGDKSVYRYTSTWNSSLEMITEKANFSVINVDPAIQGFHLYTISSPPASTNGINKPQEVKEYFGLFKVGTPDKKYKVYYKDYTLDCGGYLYRRQDNTVSTWNQVADTTSSPVMLYTSSANYGEFAATSQSVTPVTITGPAEICAGSTATLSVTNTGNGQILWSTGETSASISIKQGGKYEVTVKDGSCIRSGVINVRESSPSTFSLGEDLILCNNSSATLSAPAGMASYKWSTGETSASINITKSGTYRVVVTTTAGCTASDEINVTVNAAPEIPLPEKITTCYGEKVVLDATVPGATYLWSNEQTSPKIEIVAPANLTVDITIGGCTFTRSISVESKTNQLIKILSGGNFCTGSSTTLRVETNGSILWSTGETSNSITVNQAGEYTVTVIENGCTFTDKINISESQLPTINLGADLLLCAGETATLLAPAGMASYRWSTGATTQSLTVDKEGTYWVEVSNAAGCTSRDEINVSFTQAPPTPLLPEVATCYGEEVLLDATAKGATYSWSNGKTTPSISVTAPGTYTVNITLSNCTYTRQITVLTDECPLIPNIITPNSDGKNDTFVVQGVEQNTLELKIFNRWGKSVYQSDRYDNNWSAAGMPAGVYYYQFTSSRTGKVYKGWLEVIK